MALIVLGRNNSFYDTGIRPAKYEHGEPLYSNDEIEELIVKMMVSEQYFYNGAKKMNADTEKAIELTEDVNARFTATLDKFHGTSKKFREQAKDVSGSVRDAAEKLANGLNKIEKAANFDRLERYVELLERAAKAMELLAALEQSGKLEKIAGALR